MLLFADDLKIFYVGLTDLLMQFYYKTCLILRPGTGGIASYRMCLSVLLFNFFHKHNSFLFNYFLNGSPPSAVNEARDLGVLFSSDLSFSNHIMAITASVHRILSLIFHRGKYFYVHTLRLLYCSLVRPKLEYSIVWSPCYKYQCTLVERMQHKFSRFATFRTRKSLAFDCHGYSYNLK